MNSIESRWMRIIRYSLDEVQELHQIERDAALRWDEARKLNAPYSEIKKRQGIGWYEAGIRKMDALDLIYGPYWDPSKPKDSVNAEVAAFLAQSAVRMGFKKLEKPDTDEWQALHIADLFVHQHAVKPQFASASKAKLGAIYKGVASQKGAYEEGCP